MTFEFEPTFGEQLRAALAVLVRSWVHVAGAGGLAILGGVLVLTSLSAGAFDLSMVLGVLMLAGGVLWFPLAALLRVSNLRRSIRIAGRHAWVIDDDGIHVSAPTANLSLRWTAIVKVADTRRYFLFFFSRQSAHVLPKRVVPAEQVDALRQFVAAHRSPTRRVLSPPARRMPRRARVRPGARGRGTSAAGR